MIAQDCVSIVKTSPNDSGVPLFHSMDSGIQESSNNESEKTSGISLVSVQLERVNDTERRTTHKGEPMAVSDQATGPQHPHGFELAVIVVALCLATFLAALDQTIMATAAPKITDHYRSIDDIGW